jgi:tetratricopeptide (TPR) repeat protein
VKIEARGLLEARADSAFELAKTDVMAAEVDAAVALYSTGQHEEALSKFNAVLDIKPKHLGAQIGRNFTLLELARHSTGGRGDETLQQALANFKSLTQSHPKCWQAHVGQGEALAMTGRLDEALSSLRTAIELEPRQRRPHGTYADLMVAAGEQQFATHTATGRHEPGLQAKRACLEEALKHYDFALDATPDHWDTLASKFSTLMELAKTATVSHDFRGALAYYDTALSLNPNNPGAQRGQYLTLLALGEPRSRDLCEGALP